MEKTENICDIPPSFSQRVMMEQCNDWNVFSHCYDDPLAGILQSNAKDPPIMKIKH